MSAASLTLFLDRRASPLDPVDLVPEVQKTGDLMAVDLEKLRWAVETLRAVKDRKAELKAAEELARDAIEQALGDSDEGELDGHVVITWKSFKRNALDQQLLRDSYPELFESCRRVTEVRRFEIVEDDQ